MKRKWRCFYASCAKAGQATGTRVPLSGQTRRTTGLGVRAAGRGGPERPVEHRLVRLTSSAMSFVSPAVVDRGRRGGGVFRAMLVGDRLPCSGGDGGEGGFNFVGTVECLSHCPLGAGGWGCHEGWEAAHVCVGRGGGSQIELVCRLLIPASHTLVCFVEVCLRGCGRGVAGITHAGEELGPGKEIRGMFGGENSAICRKFFNAHGGAQQCTGEEEASPRPPPPPPIGGPGLAALSPSPSPNCPPTNGMATAANRSANRLPNSPSCAAGGPPLPMPNDPRCSTSPRRHAPEQLLNGTHGVHEVLVLHRLPEGRALGHYATVHNVSRQKAPAKRQREALAVRLPRRPPTAHAHQTGPSPADPRRPEHAAGVGMPGTGAHTDRPDRCLNFRGHTIAVRGPRGLGIYCLLRKRLRHPQRQIRRARSNRAQAGAQIGVSTTNHAGNPATGPRGVQIPSGQHVPSVRLSGPGKHQKGG